jgi:replicative DNA helicase
MNDQTLPKETYTEESILVSILLDEEQRKSSFELLNPDDFYSSANRIIFEICKRLPSNGERIEIADVYSELSDDQKKFVKADYLYSLINTVPLAVDLESYIKKLKDAARYRRAIELCNAIVKNAYKSDSEKIEKLTQQLVLETRDPKTEPLEQKDNGLSFPYQIMTGAAGYFTKIYGDVIEAPHSFLCVVSKNHAADNTRSIILGRKFTLRNFIKSLR